LCDRLLANLPLAVPALPPFIIPAKIAAVASPVNQVPAPQEPGLYRPNAAANLAQKCADLCK
jgi:hypothetical protein